MREAREPHHLGSDGVDDRPYGFDIESAQERGEPVGAARHVERGTPENAEVDGFTTDGEFGPGSD